MKGNVLQEDGHSWNDDDNIILFCDYAIVNHFLIVTNAVLLS